MYPTRVYFSIFNYIVFIFIVPFFTLYKVRYIVIYYAVPTLCVDVRRISISHSIYAKNYFEPSRMTNNIECNNNNNNNQIIKCILRIVDCRHRQNNSPREIHSSSCYTACYMYVYIPESINAVQQSARSEPLLRLPLLNITDFDSGKPSPLRWGPSPLLTVIENTIRLMCLHSSDAAYPNVAEFN